MFAFRFLMAISGLKKTCYMIAIPRKNLTTTLKVDILPLTNSSWNMPAIVGCYLLFPQNISKKTSRPAPRNFILLLGITISLLLFGMVLSLSKSHSQAIALANTTLDLEKANIGLREEITERKQAEDLLRVTEEKYRTLFESSRDAIMTLAPPTWLFTSCNPATVELFRVSDEAEFVTLGLGQLSPERQPDDKPSDEKAMDMIETAMRNGSHLFEWTHCHSDGTPFPAEVLLTRMEQKGQVFLQATVRDITDRKKAQEESEKRARLQAVLQTTGAVCHELNQPLQAIMSLMESARDDLDPANPLQRDLKDIKDNVDKMAKITRKLNNITSYQTKDYVEGTQILDLDKSSGA